MTSKTPFIIAEAGVNHNGSLSEALKMIDVAKQSGADAIKFQTFTAEDLVTKTAQKAEYQVKNTGNNSSQFEMLKALEISYPDHFKLKKHCDSIGLQFMSSPFSEKDAQFLISDLKIKTIKIGSGEITNLRMLNAIGKSQSSIVLSTGMSTLKEVQAALGAIGLGSTSPETAPSILNSQNWYSENKQSETLKSRITVLHCTSNYPAKTDELNLRAIQTLHENLNLRIGYSDHSSGSWAALVALGLGATCFEKHFTLDVKQDGPDHAASIEPDELKRYIVNIRNGFASLGSGEKKPQPSEKSTMAAARKSVVSKEDIHKGDLFTEDNITLKRPGSGISAEHFFDLLGKKSLIDYKSNQLIERGSYEN